MKNTYLSFSTYNSLPFCYKHPKHTQSLFGHCTRSVLTFSTSYPWFKQVILWFEVLVSSSAYTVLTSCKDESVKIRSKLRDETVVALGFFFLPLLSLSLCFKSGLKQLLLGVLLGRPLQAKECNSEPSREKTGPKKRCRTYRKGGDPTGLLMKFSSWKEQIHATLIFFPIQTAASMVCLNKMDLAGRLNSDFLPYRESFFSSLIRFQKGAGKF